MLASDGLFDNMFQEEILSIVAQYSQCKEKSANSAKQLARQLAEAAYAKSKQVNVKTPFNMKKAKAILEFKAKLKTADYSKSKLTSESIAPSS